MTLPPGLSAIIDFRPDEFQSSARDPIGLASLGGDGPVSFQLAKQEQVQARRAPAFSIDAEYAFDFAALTAFDFDPSALRKQVQNALFGA